jgi:hypothetical protein
MKKVEYEKYLAIWEARFPGKGVALMEIVGPFCGWKPELKPALPDLEDRVRAALSPWWEPNFGVRAFPLSRNQERWNLFYDTLDSELHESLFGPHLWTGGSLELTFGDSLFETFLESFDDTLYDSEGFSELGSILQYPCSLILLDEPESAADFKQLLQLWRDGNCPTLFDEGYKTILVLVAD